MNHADCRQVEDACSYQLNRQTELLYLENYFLKKKIYQFYGYSNGAEPKLLIG